jgi:hypothetical protein
MKRFLVGLTLLLAGTASAQDFIPNPRKLSIAFFENLRDRYVTGMDSLYLQWEDLAPLYDSTISYRNKAGITGIPTPDRDSIRQDFQQNSQAEFKAHFDTIYNRGERAGINWRNAVLLEEKSNIKTELNMPPGFWICDAKLRFQSGNQQFGITYSGLLSNNRWRIANLQLNVEVFDATGKPLCVMGDQYYEYTNETNTQAPQADVAVPKREDAPKAEDAPKPKPPSPPKPTSKKKN